MKIAQESIFSSVMRSFFVALFAIIGIAVALIIVGSVAGTILYSEYSPSTKSNINILPDADGNRTPLSRDFPAILKIDIDGIVGTEDIATKQIEQILMASREGPLSDNRVKGIILTINSPGGIAFDAQTIYRQIKDYKERYNIPIYAYVNDVCASGGYHIAVAADKIYSRPISTIGSVGVLINFFNISNLFDKVGVKSLTLTVGKNKDLMNPFRPWKENEDQEFKAIADVMYDNFVDIVTSERPNLDKDKLINEYGASVFPAKTAMEYGFIDGADYTYNKTLKELVAAAGIGDTRYQVVEVNQTCLFDKLFNPKSSLRTGKVIHTVDFGSNSMRPELNQKILYLYQ